MPIPQPPDNDPEMPMPERSRRTVWILITLTAVIAAMVALHLSGAITAH